MPLSLAGLTALALQGGNTSPTPFLTGTVWTLTALTDGGRLTSPGRLAPPVTLRLEGRDAAGSTGCNAYRSRFVTRANTLRFTPLLTTRRACPDFLDGLEDRFVTLMGQVRSFELRGATLTLFADKANRLVFRPAPSSPEVNMDLGGTWTVVRLEADGHSVPLASPAELTFGEGGSGQPLRLSGQAGCNRLSGSATLAEGLLTAGPLGVTRMLCAPEQMTQEAALLRALSAPLEVVLKGETLRLGGPAGQIELRRRA
ncbi:META domain-containing protein [Deinococcus hopiensis]|uniref:Heat shock protein HslJ n=1 Tax=Deinococcus hopiensis KR-140 TaxID=695939 RepID=A0A1W1VMF2_9DEIO|nr:META domain-containing protein [Deinococcus hopiensis]SMB94537.1 Heat shock protein HslJ [Deinococcus hopiensis KR-140]